MDLNSDKYLTTKTPRYIFYSLISFIFAVLVSIVLMLNSNFSSFSYYGTKGRTLIPFTLGLLLVGWFLFKAGQSLPASKRLKPVKYSLYALALLVLGLIATPSNLAPILRTLHVQITTVLLLTQLLLAAWLLFVVRWNNLNLGLFVVIFLGTLTMAFFYINPDLYLQFFMVPEVLVYISFGMLAIRSLSKIKPS